MKHLRVKEFISLAGTIRIIFQENKFGHKAKVLTTALLTVEEMMGAMKVAGAVTYVPPKA